MDASVKSQFYDVLLRLKKADLSISPSLGVTPGELIMLSKVAKRCDTLDGIVNVSDLHSALHISRPAISQMLNNLERRGLITREIHSDDRRKITVSLTPDGAELLHEVETSRDEDYEDIIERFGEENLRTLTSLLLRLTEIYEEKKMK